MDIEISILMGIYNCAGTLNEAIDSIINQTCKSWELILCDDGSSDNTYSIAKEYEDRYPNKIILIKNSKNMGLNYTLNHCLKYVRGKYIARMDGDDISLPKRLEIEKDFLDKNPEFAIVSTPMIYFDQDGNWGESKAIEIPTIRDFVFHNPVHCHAPCMIRTEAMLRVNGYTVDKRLLRYEDCNLWYKLYSKGYHGYNIQTPLYKMRDDHNAYLRRSPSSRMRAFYVHWIGFRMIKMPLRYYPYLLVIFLKSIIALLIPENLYQLIHRRKR